MFTVTLMSTISVRLHVSNIVGEATCGAIILSDGLPTLIVLVFLVQIFPLV
jgi:hypothetical protein